LLLVSQFTLAADTKSGLRPSFSTAAPPALGEELFDYLLQQAKQCMALWHQVDSARICRCTWSMMAR
jgi:D-Tyr-tRNAtyr deacylase